MDLPRGAVRSRQPNRQARRDQPQCIAQHHPDHRFPPRPERDPDADLASAPRRAVRDHTVQSHRRQHQREDTEEAAERRQQTVLEQGLVNALPHGARLRDRHLRR